MDEEDRPRRAPVRESFPAPDEADDMPGSVPERERVWEESTSVHRLSVRLHQLRDDVREYRKDQREHVERLRQVELDMGALKTLARVQIGIAGATLAPVVVAVLTWFLMRGR